jgi:hypothetical protein
MTRRLIRGKYDSQWKLDWNLDTDRQIRRKYKGHFDSAMNYARKTRGGIKMIQHIRTQPWTTWMAP